MKTLKIVEENGNKAADINLAFDEFVARNSARLRVRQRRGRGTRASDHGVDGSQASSPSRGSGPGSMPSGSPPPTPPPMPAAADGWDCFLSYSSKDSTLVDTFVESLRKAWPGIRIFRDSEAIRTGSDWVYVLATAIDSSQRFVALFSPDYFDSKWCRREFSAAIMRDDQGDDDILYPIYVREDPKALSLYLTFNHVDCREADLEKLNAASRKLVEHIQQ